MSAVPQPSFNQKQVLVKHHEGGVPSVDQDDIVLDRRLGEEVQWNCDHPEKAFRVVFTDGSPFASSTFDEKNNSSGPIQINAKSRAYKYSVEIDGKVYDPRVIIQP